MAGLGFPIYMRISRRFHGFVRVFATKLICFRASVYFFLHFRNRITVTVVIVVIAINKR